jgi:hypothetical protein
MAPDTLQSADDASERQHWRNTLRVLWTVLTVLVVAGVLAILTVALHWAPYLLLATLGILAGLSLLPPLLGSARSRQVTGFALGVIALPALAIWLSTIAAGRPEDFTAYAMGIAPFVAYAAAAVCVGTVIDRVRRAASDEHTGAAAAPAPKKGGTG